MDEKDEMLAKANVVYLEQRLEVIEKNLESIATTLKKLVEDHETRIRELETYYYKSKGITAILSWLGPAGVGAIILYLINQSTK